MLVRTSPAKGPMTPRLPVPILCALLLASTSSRAGAAAETAGFPVDVARAADEPAGVMVPDGSGGAFVAFKLPSTVSGTAPIRLVHVLPNGSPYGGSPPMTITGLYSEYTTPPHIVADGPGRVWLIGERDGDDVRPFSVLRAESSELIPPALHELPRADVQDVYSFVFANNRDGVFTSNSSVGRTGPGTSTWVIREGYDAVLLNDDGSSVAYPTPVRIAGSVFPPSSTAATSDGLGGALVAGVTSVTGTPSVYLYRIGSDGSLPWSPQYRVIAASPRYQDNVALIANASDGVVVAWTDKRNLATGADIYASRILPDGSLAPGWTAGGKSLATAAGLQYAPTGLGDGSGGAWLVWTDTRSGDYDLYYTHVLASGGLAAGFPVNGRPLCAVAGTQFDPQVVSDGVGGFFAAWLDLRDGEQDLYGTRIDAAGNVAAGWDANGTPLCTNPALQANPFLVATAPEHAIVLWQDSREGPQYLYALGIGSTEVLDVPRAPAAALSLAPHANPGHGAIDLDVHAPATGDVRVTLYDVAGRADVERIVAGPVRQATLRFDALRPGLYLVRASQAGASASARIIVLE